MILESRLKYKVQILLQLAKMTSDVEAKEGCINKIRTMLDLLDVTTDDPTDPLTIEFVNSLTDDEISGRTMSDIYLMFQEWSGDSTAQLISKTFKSLVSARGFVNKQKWIEGKNKRVFCKEDLTNE